MTGIVLNGTLGLEFKEGIDSIVTGNGFVIPKQTRVRIFNAGEDELILIETLQPAYKKELTKVFTDFENITKTANKGIKGPIPAYQIYNLSSRYNINSKCSP